jgi:DNA-binding transcriptional regulator YiaG
MTSDEFRAIREGVGLTLMDIAVLLGTDKSTVYRYETGGSSIPRATAIIMDLLKRGKLPKRYMKLNLP